MHEHDYVELFYVVYTSTMYTESQKNLDIVLCHHLSDWFLSKMIILALSSALSIGLTHFVKNKRTN